MEVGEGGGKGVSPGGDAVHDGGASPASEVQLLGPQAVIDKMKSVSSSLTVATTSAGDLHLQVESGGLRIACELRTLLPAGAPSGPPLTCAPHPHPHHLWRLCHARMAGCKKRSACILWEHDDHTDTSNRVRGLHPEGYSES